MTAFKSSWWDYWVTDLKFSDVQNIKCSKQKYQPTTEKLTHKKDLQYLLKLIFTNRVYNCEITSALANCMTAWWALVGLAACQTHTHTHTHTHLSVLYVRLFLMCVRECPRGKCVCVYMCSCRSWSTSANIAFLNLRNDLCVLLCFYCKFCL